MGQTYKATRWKFARQAFKARPWIWQAELLLGGYKLFTDQKGDIFKASDRYGIHLQDYIGMIPQIPLLLWTTFALLILVVWIFEASFRLHKRLNARYTRLDGIHTTSMTPRVMLDYEGSLYFSVGGGASSRKVLQIKVTNQTSLTLRQCQLLIFAEPTGVDAIHGNSETPQPASQVFTLQPNTSRDIDFATITYGNATSSFSPKRYNQDGDKFTEVEMVGHWLQDEISIHLVVVADDMPPAALRLIAKRQGREWEVFAKTDAPVLQTVL